MTWKNNEMAKWLAFDMNIKHLAARNLGYTKYILYILSSWVSYGVAEYFMAMLCDDNSHGTILPSVSLRQQTPASPQPTQCMECPQPSAVVTLCFLNQALPVYHMDSATSGTTLPGKERSPEPLGAVGGVDAEVRYMHTWERRWDVTCPVRRSLPSELYGRYKYRIYVQYLSLWGDRLVMATNIGVQSRPLWDSEAGWTLGDICVLVDLCARVSEWVSVSASE